jgi:RNA-directed DNA polymerase
MRVKLSEIKQELRRRMHQPISEQGRWLAQVMRGFFAYHAVPTNFPALGAFHHHVMRLWLLALQRRSQKDRTTWERIAKLAADYLPKPHTLHPWPQQRFAARHPRWEPRAGIPLARFCAGGGRSELLAIAQFWNKDGKIIRVSATQAVLSTEKSIIETHCDNAKR